MPRFKNVFQRSADWAMAKKMLLLWREVRREATGTPEQRDIYRMMVMLEYVREFDHQRKGEGK